MAEKELSLLLIHNRQHIHQSTYIDIDMATAMYLNGHVGNLDSHDPEDSGDSTTAACPLDIIVPCNLRRFLHYLDAVLQEHKCSRVPGLGSDSLASDFHREC